jgi:hypothetical protein
MQPPLGRLAYLYIGVRAGLCVLPGRAGGRGRLGLPRLRGQGRRLPCLRRPLFLLADHRPAPSCMPVLAVEDLDATVAELKSRGWQSEGDGFKILNGPCYRFNDPSGNPVALFQNLRPDSMEKSFADKDNPNAIRATE